MRLEKTFFQRPPTDCARDLIGCTLHHDGCSGVIVETEAYAAVGDEACHTFYKRVARTFVDVNEAGTAYIYLNYGVHWLLNILTKTMDGETGFVLIRAVDPARGEDVMHQRRTKTRALKNTDLCSGPGKLTVAFGIGPESHCTDLTAPDSPIYFTPRKAEDAEIVTGPRIGISKAADYPWRYGLAGNRHLSRPF